MIACIMTRSVLPTSRGLLVTMFLVGTFAPDSVVAQQQPYTMEALDLWISGGVRVPRILRYVEGRCFDFDLTPVVQDQLRRKGASEVLIAGLVERCPPRPTQIAVNPPVQPLPEPQPGPELTNPSPPVVQTQGTGNVPSPPLRSESRYSRRVLYPLYYDRPAIVTAFGGVMTPEWQGTDAGTHQVNLPNGNQIRVRMPEAPTTLPTYGVSIGSAGGLRLEMEGYFHQTDFPMLLMGPSVEPFLPLGRTRFRVILGATGWLAVAGQHMAVVDEFGEETSDTLSVTSYGAGGDGRAGLAYHPKPGVWIFAEARYRWVETFYRYADVSSSEYVEDFPWSKLGVRGPSVRIGIGF